MAQQPEVGRKKTGSRGSGKPSTAKPSNENGQPAQSGDTPPVVGIGASAGSLDPLKDLVTNAPQSSGVAWVLVQHMAPDRESHLSQILGRSSGLPVIEVNENTKIEPDHIYVIAPGQTMTVRDGTLHTVADTEPLARRTSIDAFFLSLAEALGPRSGCALLSGAGTDGTIGLKAVKEAGGLTLTQTLDTAQYDSMLLSAVRTGLVDRELPVAEMPRVFVDFLIERLPAIDGQAVSEGDRSEIVVALRKAVGHDFSGYKHSTFDRRVRRRMVMLGVTEFPDYLEQLLRDRDEASKLFRDLLIGVTQFFRDPEAFEALAEKAIPEILKGKTADDEIRVWSAGCATGEEAYSLAILFHEQASKLDSVPEIRVFGSDIDENALHVARMGRYPKGIEADLSPERLERYFQKEDGTYAVRGELRDMCLFAQHNMLRDPPFSRVDLLSCRNTLIYMNAELQKHVIPVFHYALKRGGILFVGPAENASQPAKLFREVDRTHRIFRRTGEAAHLPVFPLAAGDGRERPRQTPAREIQGHEAENLRTRTTRRVLERYAPPYVVVDSDLEILESSGRTGDYLELPIGQPRINLSAMARSGLAVDVRAALGKVMATGEPVTRRGLVVSDDDETRHVTLVVERLSGASRGNAHYLVVFQPEVEPAPQPAEGRRVEDEEVVRALEQELTNTKERLQTALEELETSNEELKAANEDLSSVNEELQSSNEELETSREELQSINEELRTVNDELNSRVDELSRANNDLKNLFANTEIAMLFLDAKFRVMNFTPPAKPLFHLRDHDIGRPLDELSGRIDHLALKEEMKAVIRDGKQREREVQTNNDDPRTFIMRMLPYRDTDERIKGAVLTFIDITGRKHDEERLARMVSELNHRVKNTLASVQSIIRLTAQGASSLEDFEETLLGRVQAMAAGHNLISEADWQHAELEELARAVVEPLVGEASERLTISGPRIRLRAEAAVPVAMILHELATNAARHGAWSAAGGAVTLRWEMVQTDAGQVKLTWTETGGPRVTAPEAPGFGLRFIQQRTEYDLDGECGLAFDREGFSCTFTLPASEFIASPKEDAGVGAR